MAVNYAKRWMEEGVYDRAFETAAGRKTQNLSIGTRYAIEAALSASSAVLIRSSEDDGLLAKALKELGSDIAPELAKRLINGKRHATGRQWDLSAGLSTSDLETLDDWARQVTPEQRQAVVDRLTAFTMSDLVKVARVEDTPESGGKQRPTAGGLEASTAAVRRMRRRVEDVRRRLGGDTSKDPEAS